MELHVRVIEARDLPNMDIVGDSDPYCILQISGTMSAQKTKVIIDCHDPTWNEDFHFPVMNPASQSLIIFIKDSDYLSDDDMCTIEIKLNPFTINQVFDRWFDLIPCDGADRGGRIHLLLHIAPTGQTPFITDSSTISEEKQSPVLGYCNGGIGYYEAIKISNPDSQLTTILQDVKSIIENLNNESSMEQFKKYILNAHPYFDVNETVYEILTSNQLSSQEIDTIKGKSNEKPFLLKFSGSIKTLILIKSFNLEVEKKTHKIVSDELNQINVNATQALDSLRMKLKTKQCQKNAAIQDCIQELINYQTQLNQMKKNGFQYYYDKVFEDLAKDTKRIKTKPNNDVFNNTINTQQLFINSLLESLKLFNEI